MFDMWRDPLEQRLKHHVSHLKNKLAKPMQHALLSGGKRLRPWLFMTTLKAYGFEPLDYLDIACAIEMVHTYSLVHDDLPAMDDDAWRRGHPTVHVAYDEATAILTGDALLTDAFGVLVAQKNLDGETRAYLVGILAEHAGSQGMISGQMLDLKSAGETLDLASLETLHRLKTGCLIQAALMMAGAIAAVSDVEQLKIMGTHLGLAFQIQDDCMDITKTEAVMGKSLSDTAHDKATFVRLLGLEQAQDAALKQFRLAQAACQKLDADGKLLAKLIDQIEMRQN